MNRRPRSVADRSGGAPQDLVDGTFAVNCCEDPLLGGGARLKTASANIQTSSLRRSLSPRPQHLFAYYRSPAHELFPGAATNASARLQEPLTSRRCGLKQDAIWLWPDLTPPQNRVTSASQAWAT